VGRDRERWGGTGRGRRGLGKLRRGAEGQGTVGGDWENKEEMKRDRERWGRTGSVGEG